MDWSAIVPALAYLGLAGSCAVYFLQVCFYLDERNAHLLPEMSMDLFCLFSSLCLPALYVSAHFRYFFLSLSVACTYNPMS